MYINTVGSYFMSLGGGVPVQGSGVTMMMVTDGGTNRDKLMGRAVGRTGGVCGQMCR